MQVLSPGGSISDTILKSWYKVRSLKIGPGLEKTRYFLNPKKRTRVVYSTRKCIILLIFLSEILIFSRVTKPSENVYLMYNSVYNLERVGCFFLFVLLFFFPQ